jgi:tetratricopeptide (TPR) repeat protein
VTIDQLNIKYSLIDRKKDFAIIDFFNENALAIQNLDEDKHTDILTTKLCILSDYAYALANSGEYSKSIPFLVDSIRLQEQHPTFLDNIKKSKNYEFLVFALGRALHQTGDINESRKIFEKLIRLAPDNEAYQAWIVGTSNHKRNRVIKYVNISFMVWFLVVLFFRDRHSDGIDLLLIVLGLALFSILILLSLLNYLTKTKYQKKIMPQNGV